MADPIFPMMRAPIPTTGALVGVAERYTTDRRRGSSSSATQYVGSAVFGAGTALVTANRTLPITIVTTAVSAVAENYALDGSSQPADVAANVAGSVVARYTGNAVSTPQVSATISGATEYATYSTISSLLDRFAY